MTTFTINGGAITKWDSLSGGSADDTLDAYNVSAQTTLLIETDSMYCAGHSVAAGSLDQVYFVGTGGKVQIDGNNVRVIPYNTGSGTVPAIGTTISRLGVSGYLLGVWANWQSEPTAVGGAMPASGYIKIKDKTGGTYSAGALTGIGASATGADVVGWIEVRGADTGEILESRLGTFEVTGDWFYLDNTNGARGQVIPCPTTATNAGCWSGGVQIETAVGSGVYEWYRSLGTMSADATIPTDATRGKVIWQTTGGIRIGSDGTNNVGFLPVTGLRVRIGNVIMTCCARSAGGSGARVVPNSSLSTRMEHRPAASGIINQSKCHTAWYNNCSGTYSSSFQNCGISDNLIFNTQQLALDCVGNCIATTQVQTDASESYTLINCYAGGTFTDNVGFRQNDSFVFRLTDVFDVVFARNHGTLATDGGNVWDLNRVSGCTWQDDVAVGGRANFQSSKLCTMANFSFAQHYRGQNTGGVNNSGAVDCEAGCSDIVIDGILFPVAENHPRSWLVGFVQSRNCTLRNAGTYAAYLSAGTVNPMLYLIGRKFSFADYSSKLQRCFVSGLTGISSHDTNNYKLTLENVFGDFADTYASLSPDSTAKGCGFATFTNALNSVFGAIWRDHFTSTTVGKIHLMMNETTALTAAQFSITSGAVLFNGSGQVVLAAVGDQAIWEMAYFALGHTALANIAPTIVENAANHTYVFQHDTGAGYNGIWLTLNAANLNGVGALDPAVGVRLKIRITCATASSNNTVSSVLIDTVTTAAAQSTNLYPLASNTLTLTGIVSGSRYRVERVSDGLLIGQGASTGGPDAVIHSLAVNTTCRVVVRKSSAAPKFLPYENLITLGDFPSSSIVSQTADLVAV